MCMVGSVKSQVLKIQWVRRPQVGTLKEILYNQTEDLYKRLYTFYKRIQSVILNNCIKKSHLNIVSTIWACNNKLQTLLYTNK